MKVYEEHNRRPAFNLNLQKCRPYQPKESKASPPSWSLKLSKSMKRWATQMYVVGGQTKSFDGTQLCPLRIAAWPEGRDWKLIISWNGIPNRNMFTTAKRWPLFWSDAANGQDLKPLLVPSKWNRRCFVHFSVQRESDTLLAVLWCAVFVWLHSFWLIVQGSLMFKSTCA